MTAVPTTSIPALISTMSMNAPTGAGSRSPRSKPSSTPNYCGVWTSIRRRCRREWCDLLEGTDACFAPVLTTEEAPQHPHNAARRTYVEIDGIVQPAPAPRFSRTVPELPTPPQPPAGLEEADAILGDWLEPAEIKALRASGTI